MKTLLLLRHAHAQEASSHRADHDRPLSDRGRREAAAVAARLRRRGLHPDRVVASAAQRARQTAWAVAGRGATVSETWSLYGAGPGLVLEILRGLPETVACALVVAHNPGLEELVQHLTGSRRPMAPAMLVRVSLPVAHWRELTDAIAGRLEEVWQPPAG